MSERIRLVLFSFLMLFVELALIRWTGSNILYLSYFSNFVLLGSFLGIGLGFLRARSPRSLFPYAPVLLAALVVFVRLFPAEINRSSDAIIYFGSFRTTGLPAWIMLPLLFVAVGAVMCAIADGVARSFARFDSLEAYRLDIIGSLLGIVAFSIVSFLRGPPLVWGVVVAALFLILMRPSFQVIQVAALVVMTATLLFETLDPFFSWSPYYRVTVVRRADDRFQIFVNGVPHQEANSVALRREREPLYFLAYDRIAKKPPRDVLIVGAGNGTDVAIALSMGVRHVDAVEIDPRLQEIGRDLHPDHPYQDPRVQVHIQDGRAFLEQTDRRYDLILFALPDSLTLVAGQSSLRLESYLFTREAMHTAHNHLAPGGAFGMYNFYRQQWLIERLARTLADEYGRSPCVDSVGGAGRLALLMASDDAGAVRCPNQPIDLSDASAPSNDDHPFLYLRTASIPAFYLLTIGLILLTSLLAIRAVAGPYRQMRPFIDLFFMGVAFLLLETKNVVQFALLFGTTWFVNALVFAGVLVSVLLAIEVARRVRLVRPIILYGVLFAAIATTYAIPQHTLLNLGFVPRLLAATALAFAPIFLANLVFAQRFAGVGDSTTAFGANLLGAMIGGILEYLALIVGYRAILIVVAVAYGLAFVSGKRALAETRSSG